MEEAVLELSEGEATGREAAPAGEVRKVDESGQLDQIEAKLDLLLATVGIDKEGE